MRVRRATAADAAAIASIYAPYVAGSAISFETEPPGEAQMRARIEAGGDLYPWFVACADDGPALGYASACAFRARPAYRFTVETTVYVADGAHRRGIGTLLYGALLPLLEAQGFTQAIAAITLPNPASVAMHEALGFTKAGVYEKVGFKLGRWLSVGLWQRALAPISAEPADPRPLSAIGD
ncbi:MAG TPA: GNAT family N-acetyltransferase [Allosphingosinicella sp.]|nr:GNAT family N-acetyltransferase [Allosphingosinicella sp.]